MGKHTLSDRSDGIKFEAWARNAVAFIRSKGLESEFSDWCGGFPVPVAGTEAMQAAAPDHHAAAVEIDRLSLVIESAVRNADPAYREEVLAALKANRAAIRRAHGEGSE